MVAARERRKEEDARRARSAPVNPHCHIVTDNYPINFARNWECTPNCCLVHWWIAWSWEWELFLSTIATFHLEDPVSNTVFKTRFPTDWGIIRFQHRWRSVPGRAWFYPILENDCIPEVVRIPKGPFPGIAFFRKSQIDFP